MLGALLSLLVSGLIIGLLARFAVPGKDPLKLWQTILLGVSGSLARRRRRRPARRHRRRRHDRVRRGTASLAFSLGGAIVLLILYRKFVQKRPLTGPDARSPRPQPALPSFSFR